MWLQSNLEIESLVCKTKFSYEPHHFVLNSLFGTVRCNLPNKHIALYFWGIICSENLQNSVPFPNKNNNFLCTCIPSMPLTLKDLGHGILRNSVCFCKLTSTIQTGLASVLNGGNHGHTTNKDKF